MNKLSLKRDTEKKTVLAVLYMPSHNTFSFPIPARCKVSHFDEKAERSKKRLMELQAKNG